MRPFSMISILYSAAPAAFVPIIYDLVNSVNLNNLNVNYLVNMSIYNVNCIVYNVTIR